MIEVRLFATLREGREKIMFMDAAKHNTVESILQAIGITEHDVAICLVNGFHAKVTASVKQADVISLFPPVGGG